MALDPVSSPNILIVEDDPEIRALVEDYLQKNGFAASSANGGAALDRHLAANGPPDLIVLDVMLPGEDGLSICRRLRASSHVPILMLTAKGDDIDCIIGLEMGADDYLPKPFNPRELVARIRAILRRNDVKPNLSRRLKAGGIVVDLDARAVMTENGEAIELTAAEFDLLECFVTRPGRVLSRDQLMDWTRGRRADTFDRTIDVQLSRLRRKIEEPETPLFKTIRNAGYILTARVEEV
jgi:two-component system OmpR family response regulator